MRPHVLTILQRVADGDAAAVNECLEGKQAGTCRKLPVKGQDSADEIRREEEICRDKPTHQR